MTNIFAVVVLVALLLAFTCGDAKRDDYGPWPGARPAPDAHPVPDRPLAVRDVRFLGRLPESHNTPLEIEPGKIGGYGSFDAFMGKTAGDCSDMRVDDTPGIYAEVRSLTSAPGLVDTIISSRGRNVSGNLNSVELSA
jgi:hypothetical protein